MARYNLTSSPADERRFADLAYGFGWNLALHTPGAARPAPIDDLWQPEIRSVALVVWLAQPDAEAGVELVDDRRTAREAFQESFLRGYQDCLHVLCCWQCGAPRVEELGRHFCTAGCREAWRAEHDSSEWAEILVCHNCKGPLEFPDQSFCGVLCEAEWTVAAVAR